MNQLQKILEIFNSLPEPDWKGICVKIASKHPTVFLRYAHHEPEHVATCREIMKKDGRLVDAIKVWRNATGDSLFDAKRAVEALR